MSIDELRAIAATLGPSVKLAAERIIKALEAKR